MGALIVAMSMALLTVVPVSADTTFTIETSGAAEVCEPADPATCGGDGTGTAVIDVTTDTDEVCFDLTGEGVTLPITAGHIHEAAEGVAGPVVVPLFTEPEAEFPISGCVTADAGLVAEIEADPANYYVNLHNEEFPDGALRGQLAVAGGGEPETGMVMIMKHYCNADDSNPETTVDVRSEEEFMEVEAGGMGDPIVAVALTVLACPTERLPGDAPVSDTIAHFEEEFDFLVTDSTGAEFTLADATFTQLHACEADDGRSPLVLGEVDGDAGTNVCVDFSFYAIDGVAEGEVSVVETFHEGEHEFGTVRFTPAEVDPDDDSRTLLGFDRASSTVNIDTSLDDDAMVMLHIYNFDTAAAAATPAASELPDAAVNGSASNDSLPLLVGLSGLLLAISAGFVARQRGIRLS